MKLDTILNLDTKMKQIVMTPTRLNPAAILDPIMTTLGLYYQTPVCLPPLDSDDGESQSDHLTVIAEPISAINNKPARKIKKVKVRRQPESGKALLKGWFSQQTWEQVSNAVPAHDKADILQTLIMERIDQYLPEKTVCF